MVVYLLGFKLIDARHLFLGNNKYKKIVSLNNKKERFLLTVLKHVIENKMILLINSLNRKSPLPLQSGDNSAND
ncbi:hypothetical protein DLK05_05185 [Ancylomarina longa]|uniref:Uncharacterized protein n=1 Tax=Ancylomarina longa TaxID=2487017 RepID=A0A434AXF2_9BACT|nr:hypothetical protein DLK05_05185 [Ancylomarina longa]